MQEIFEKILKELDKLTSEECTLHECGIRSERCKPCIAKKAVEIVKQAAAEYNNGWIPVEDRLPERNKPVLVYAESRTISGTIITMVGAFNNGFWFVQDGVDTLGFPCRNYRVVAWQPLPEPYQQKGE